MRHNHALRVSASPVADSAAGDLTTPPAPEAHAVSVETIFAGASICTRLLPPVRETARAAASPRFLAAGAVLLALSLTSFVAASVRAADERVLLAAWTARGHEASTFVASPRPAVPLDILFVLGLLGGGALMVVGLHRRADDQRRFRRTFAIGSAADVDAPFDPSRLGAPSHALVTHSSASSDYLVHPAPSMTGVVESDGRSYTLAEILEPGTSTFRLPPGARVRLESGRTSFVIRSIQRPAPIGRPRAGLSAAEAPYTLGAALALGLFVLIIFTIPPDPRSLSLDLLGAQSRLISFNVLPPVLEKAPVPTWLASAPAPAGGAAAPAAKEPRGASGDPTSREHARRRNEEPRPPALADQHPTKEDTVARANNAGVLGILKASRNQLLTDLLDPLGSVDASLDAAALGDLTGTQVGESWGFGGIGSAGTGSGGGGTGEGLRGRGGLATRGHGGGGSASGAGYDRGAGSLGGRRAHAPEIMVGDATVRGSLDKEIIRRIIHRHINEVRFCYEESLRQQPRLAGRVGVQFTIAGNGQVLTSVLQSSTVGNANVENCTVAAVRRWQFPQPAGGGLVVVSYPFVFTQPE